MQKGEKKKKNRRVYPFLSPNTFILAAESV